MTELPLPEKRGLNRAEAAAYLGLSPGAFDARVKDETFPQPLMLGSRKVWDRKALDAVLDRKSGLGAPSVSYEEAKGRMGDARAS